MAVKCVERKCALYFGEIPDGRHLCMAFLGGIPARILEGDDLHLERAPDQTGDGVYTRYMMPYESHLRALAKRAIGWEAALTAPLPKCLAAVEADPVLWEVWTTTHPEYQNGDPDAGKPWPLTYPLPVGDPDAAAKPQCVIRGCGHYAGVAQPDGTEETERHVCMAFPDGIPDRIAYGDDLHLEIAEDQRGEIVFEVDDLPDTEDEDV